MTRMDRFRTSAGNEPCGFGVDADRMPEMCRSCAMRGAALCRSIWRAEKSAVRTPHVRRMEADEMLVEEGDDPDFLGVLRSGYLRQERLTRDGRRTVLRLSYPGDMVGTLTRSPCSLEAATQAEVCAFDIGTIRRLMAEVPGFRREMMHEATAQYARQLEMNWQRGTLSSRERVLAFLVMAADTMPVFPNPDGSLDVTIGLARRDWAGLSNTTVETVSRTMSHLSDEGLVTRLAPSRYRILDLARLRLMAGLDPEPAPVAGRAAPRAVLADAAPDFAPRLTAVNAGRSRRGDSGGVLVKGPRERGPDDGSYDDVRRQIQH